MIFQIILVVKKNQFDRNRREKKEAPTKWKRVCKNR